MNERSKPTASDPVASNALLSHKRLIFETVEERDIGGKGMFDGMKIKAVTKPFPPECDWPEDSDHESGIHFNKCISCEADFIGHKTRKVCRKCHYESKERYEAMTHEEKEEWDAERAEEIDQYFRDNEIVHTLARSED